MDISLLQSLLLVLIPFVCNLTRACPPIEMQMAFQLVGQGFHRRMHLDVNLASKHRLVNCLLVYSFQIPPGAYLDVFELNRQFDPVRTKRPTSAHCLSAEHFDIEAPKGESDLPQTVQFYSSVFPRKVFLLSDKLEFPVHLRYHRPMDAAEYALSGGKALIQFKVPSVHLQCEQNETFVATCQTEKVRCQCKKHEKCAWIRLSHKPIPELEAFVPVGNASHATIVTAVTLAVVFGCAVYIWVQVWKSSCSEGTDETVQTEEEKNK